MIRELAKALANWADAHGGIYPTRIRVSPWVNKRIDDDAKELSLVQRLPGGITKLLGVDLVEDEKVFFAEVDGG